VNERQAVRFAANLLRTLATMTEDYDDERAGLRAARMLDRYYEEGESE